MIVIRTVMDNHNHPLMYLSCPSFLLLFLLLRAILALQLTFLAGPTLIEVFSSAVVCSVTLLPLWYKQDNINTRGYKAFCLSDNKSSYLEQELHHLGVDESLDRLPVNVSDEVARF